MRLLLGGEESEGPQGDPVPIHNTLHFLLASRSSHCTPWAGLVAFLFKRAFDGEWLLSALLKDFENFPLAAPPPFFFFLPF